MKKQLIFDIGGTYIKYAYVTDAHIDYGSFPVIDSAGKEDVPTALANFIAQYQVDEIGISVPGPFDLDNGISLIDFKLLSLYRVNLRELIKKHLPNAKVMFVHDAVAFTLGAVSQDSKLLKEKVACAMLGTGLGYAYCEYGRIWVNKAKIAMPELSFQKHRNERIDDITSATGLINKAKQAGYHFRYVKDMAKAAETDEKLKAIFYEVGQFFGEVMNNEQKVDGFTRLIIGGGVSNVWYLLKKGFESVSKIDYQIITDSTACPIQGVRFALNQGQENIYFHR